MPETPGSERVEYTYNRAGFAALHPSVEPRRAGMLDVGDGHRVYWEASGNPQGKPALILHGGPGGCGTAQGRRFFSAQRYRIIAFDQRGCGRSTPLGGLRANTTAHLLQDIEALRRHLGVDRWLLFGGSWGATLALAYAQAHPQRVEAMVLRGVFTARAAELRWLYQGGAAHCFPDAWACFQAPIPADERDDMPRAYARRLAPGMDGEGALAAARAWCAWEDALMPQGQAAGQDGAAVLAMARVGAHYLSRNCFLPEGGLLAAAGRLRDIPGVIVQGRYDLVTPMRTAWDLCGAWPGARLQVVEGAGHASAEPGIMRCLVEAIDRFAGG